MFGVNTIIILANIKRSRVFLLEPQQNNISNPEAYSKLCQTSKVFCENSQRVKAVNVFPKTLHLRCSTEF